MKRPASDLESLAGANQFIGAVDAKQKCPFDDHESFVLLRMTMDRSGRRVGRITSFLNVDRSAALSSSPGESDENAPGLDLNPKKTLGHGSGCSRRAVETQPAVASAE
jgi:hypothetical protein